jgi:serine phosphatase RsbU (regulator of sigma subunit)/CHASE3 domain sensor protein
MVKGGFVRGGTAARWVVTVAAATSVVLAGLGTLLVTTALDLRSAQLRQTDQFGAAAQTTSELLGDFVDEETGLRGYVITGQKVFLDPYMLAQPRIASHVRSLQSLTAHVPETRARLGAVDAAHRDWSTFAREQINRVEAGHTQAAASVTATGAGKARFDLLRDRVIDLDSALTAAGAANLRRVAALQRRLVAEVVTSLLLLAAILVAGTRLLLAGLVQPVHALAAGARAVADGDLSAVIPGGGAPEVVAMATDVRAMRDRLLADKDSVEAALEALDQHGPAVTALREALAPHPGQVPGLVVAGRMEPAEGLLAGDWYDLIPVPAPTPGHRLAVVLGDVSGHGPRSAVLALRLKHALAATLRAGAAPGEALAATSRALLDVPAELFATVLIVLIDTAADRLVYANAGHPAALLLERHLHSNEPLNPREQLTALTGLGDRPLSWLDLPSTGPLLSPIVAGWSWGQAEHRFEVDDTLIAFTDGLLEARNEAGEQFGLQRVLRVIGDHGLADGPRLLNSLAAEAARHLGTGRRRDDQTLLYARRTDPATLPLRS